MAKFIILALLLLVAGGLSAVTTRISPLPRPTVSPAPPSGCYYQQVQCIRAPCDPILVCPTSSPPILPIDNGLPEFLIDVPTGWFFDGTTLASYDFYNTSPLEIPPSPFIKCDFAPFSPSGYSSLESEEIIKVNNPQISRNTATIATPGPGPEKFTLYQIQQSGFPSIVLGCAFFSPELKDTLHQILSSFKFRSTIPPSSPIPSAGCKTGGCSGELCVEASAPDQVSICVYRDEYDCLKYSRCERQPSGSCGWTQTPQYLSCLQNLPSR